MKKVSNVVILASLSMLGQQVQAKQAINVDSNKVSAEACESIKSKLNNRAVKCAISLMSTDFAKTVTIDGETNRVDIFSLANQDSRDVQLENNGYVSSYYNCHSACHGSRGWR